MKTGLLCNECVYELNLVQVKSWILRVGSYRPTDREKHLTRNKEMRILPALVLAAQGQHLRWFTGCPNPPTIPDFDLSRYQGNTTNK